MGSMDISMGSSPHQYVYVPLYKPLDVEQNVDPIEYDNIKKRKFSLYGRNYDGVLVYREDWED